MAIDTQKAEKSPYCGIGGGDSEEEAVDNATSSASKPAARCARQW